jgi:4-hydroxy-tetrahydrodipicolinate synthase
MGLTTNPIPVKAAMAELGFSVGSPRLPLIDLTSEQLKILKETLGRHGVL